MAAVILIALNPNLILSTLTWWYFSSFGEQTEQKRLNPKAQSAKH